MLEQQAEGREDKLGPVFPVESSEGRTARMAGTRN